MRVNRLINVPLLFILVGLGYYFDVPSKLGLVNIHKEPLSVKPDPVPEVPSPYDGCDDCSMAARQIAWSLDHQISEWSSDTYIIHRGNVWIWIANGAYGLQVGKDHSVTPSGYGWIPTRNEKRIIVNAYQRWRDKISLHAEDIHP